MLKAQGFCDFSFAVFGEMSQHQLNLFRSEAEVSKTENSSDDVEETVSFDNFVRIFAHLRPIHKNEARNKMNSRLEKIKCKRPQLLQGINWFATMRGRIAQWIAFSQRTQRPGFDSQCYQKFF